MSLIIDRTTWDTTQFRAPGNGYSVRTGPLPDKIIWHTTNGNAGSSFGAECDYLSNKHQAQEPDNQVCAQYMVGKQGQIARLLDSHGFYAWAVGDCIPGFSNSATISIEYHHAVGEAWTVAQLQAGELLTLELCTVYPIGNLETCLMTHRGIALPHGRKSDPDDYSDLDFGTVRARLQCQRMKQ